MSIVTILTAQWYVYVILALWKAETGGLGLIRSTCHLSNTVSQNKT